VDEQLSQLIGPQSSDSGLTKRMRFHQGWWRAFVLCELPGPHPRDLDKDICNTVHNGEQTGYNFLSAGVRKAVHETLTKRVDKDRGLIEENRLFNNLLSSQPLCFNFFGDMRSDKNYALAVISGFFPEVTRVFNTIFEYAPEANYTADNSAYDVAFEVEIERKRGLIGLECKFTDDFSKTKYDKPAYRDIYNRSEGFVAEYEEMIEPKFNQLFRNQLISEALVLNREYDFSISGLFCHPEDESALDIARQFQSNLKDGESRFRIITYWDFIECVQKADINKAQREFVMMLWARYLGSQLSTRAFDIIA
jgi:effector-binding domain-containing protein